MPAPTDAPLVSWNEGSNTRGTYDIISLCASTLLICAWSAVHVDIPTRPTFWNVYVKRAGWLIVGLVWPEMLVLTALGQLTMARELVADAQTYLPASSSAPVPLWRRGLLQLSSLSHRASNSLKSGLCHTVGSVQAPSAPTALENVSPPSDPERGPRTPLRTNIWTLAHGFYAAMGGFVFETAPGQPFLQFSDTRAVVTPAGVKFLMEHAPELIPDISADDIADRSKAGAITKALLCCQVVFFCGSCTARLNQQLPLTLLEVTTFAHSICALLAYSLWWYKPQDVGQPTLISGDKARELCALMLISSNAEQYYPLGLGKSRFWPCELDYLSVSECTPTQSTRDLETVYDRLHRKLAFAPTSGFLGFSPKTHEEIIALMQYRAPPSVEWPSSHIYPPWYMRFDQLAWYIPPQPWRRPIWFLDGRDITRLALARRALLWCPVRSDMGMPWHKRWPMLLPVQRSRVPLERLPRFQLRLAPALIAALYGLPHLLALV